MIILNDFILDSLKDVSPSAVKVYLLLRGYSDYTGKKSVWPSIRRIMGEGDLARDTVRKAIKELKEKGLIVQDEKSKYQTNEISFITELMVGTNINLGEGQKLVEGGSKIDTLSPKIDPKHKQQRNGYKNNNVCFDLKSFCLSLSLDESEIEKITRKFASVDWVGMYNSIIKNDVKNIPGFISAALSKQWVFPSGSKIDPVQIDTTKKKKRIADQEPKTQEKKQTPRTSPSGSKIDPVQKREEIINIDPREGIPPEVWEQAEERLKTDKSGLLLTGTPFLRERMIRNIAKNILASP